MEIKENSWIAMFNWRGDNRFHALRRPVVEVPGCIAIVECLKVVVWMANGGLALFTSARGFLPLYTVESAPPKVIIEGCESRPHGS